MDEAYEKLMGLERELRAADHDRPVEAVAKFAKLLPGCTDHPLVVTAGVLRLCQVFRDCKDNSMRYEVFASLRRLHVCIELVHCIDEIARRLCSVLADADPDARVLTLMTLALFAKRLSSQSYIFHQAVMLPESSYEKEQEAASKLCIKLAIHQQSFSSFLYGYVTGTRQPLTVNKVRLAFHVRKGAAASVAIFGRCKSEYLQSDDIPLRVALVKCMCRHSARIRSARSEFRSLCIDELGAVSKRLDGLHRPPWLVRLARVLLVCVANSSAHFERLECVQAVLELLRVDELLPSIAFLSHRYGGVFHGEIEAVAKSKAFSFRLLTSLLRSISHLKSPASFQPKIISSACIHFGQLSNRQKTAFLRLVIEKQNWLDESFVPLLIVRLIERSFASPEAQLAIAAVVKQLSVEQVHLIRQQTNGSVYLIPLGPSLDVSELVRTSSNDLLNQSVVCIRLQEYKAAYFLTNSVLVPRARDSFLLHYFQFLSFLSLSVLQCSVRLLFEASSSLEMFGMSCNQKFRGFCKKPLALMEAFALSRDDCLTETRWIELAGDVVDAFS